MFLSVFKDDFVMNVTFVRFEIEQFGCFSLPIWNLIGEAYVHLKIQVYLSTLL